MNEPLTCPICSTVYTSAVCPNLYRGANIHGEQHPELLDFIYGRGQWSQFGTGIHTHPGYDENADRIYAACQEIEASGLIVRSIDEPGHVVFVPSYA